MKKSIRVSVNSSHSLRDLRAPVRRFAPLAASIATLIAAGHSAFAASATWLATPVDATWGGANWAAAAPGAITGTANGDMATFNAALGGSGFGGATAPVVIDSGRNIKNITFDTAAGAYVIGSTAGNSLLLTTGGTTQIASTYTATTGTMTVSAPLIVQAANGTYVFGNNKAAAGVSLILNGALSGGAAGNTVVTFGGSATPTMNYENGIISNGSATTLGLTLIAGNWTYSGNNTYTGPTNVTGGNQYFTGTNTSTGAINIGTGAASSGVLLLSGLNGSSANSSAVNVNLGGTLTYDNGSTSAVNNSRLGTVNVNLNGGTFKFNTQNGSASTVNSLVLASGQTSYLSTGAAASGTSLLTIGSIGNGAHATLSGSMVNAQAATGQVVVTTAPTLVNGIIPWAVETGSCAFLTVSSGSNLLGGYGNVSGTNVASWGGNLSTDNVQLTATPATLTGNNTVNSLNLKQTTATTVNLGGYTLTLNSGGLLVGNNAATLSSAVSNGTLTTGTGSNSGGELFVHVLTATANPLNIGAVIADNGTGGSAAVSLTKGSAGELDLSGVNTYTGPTTVAAGTLKVLSGGAINASPTVSVAQGAILTVNAGGTVGGNVTVNRSTDKSIANFTNNGTVSGSINLIAPVSGQTYVYGANQVAGHASLGAGSTTGPVVANGQLDLTGASALSVGTISGSGTTGAIYLSNSYNNGGAGNTYTFQGGSAFSMLNLAAGSFATLASAGTGPVYFAFYGYNGAFVSNINGGAWNFGQIGQNNTGGQTGGTTNIVNGAAVTVLAGQTQYSHGTWNVTNGSMSFLSAVSQNHGSASTYSLNFNVNNSGGGAGSTLSTVGNLTLGETVVGVTDSNSLTVGSGGTASIGGALVLGTTGAQTSETNTVTLQSGGKLLVSGAIQTTAGTGQTNSFIWSGGQLTALTVTPGAAFNGGSSSINSTTLTNNAGTLAPGDAGKTGLTTISGTYTQGSGGTLAIDLGGTTASTVFQDAGLGKFDKIAVTGAASLAGNLTVNLLPGFSTGTNSFTVLASTGALTAISGSGSFQDGFPQTVTTSEGFSRMTVETTGGVGGTVVLKDYTITNQWQGTGPGLGGTWGTAGGTAMWSAAIDPTGTTQGAYFGSTGGGGTVTLGNDRTVGTMVFNSGTGYTLAAGSGTLTLQSNNSAVGLSDIAGSHTIAVPMTLASNLIVAVANPADTLTISSNIAGTGTVSMSGSGTLRLTGTNAFSGLAVNGGTVAATKLASLPNYSTAGAYSVSSGGMLLLNAGGTDEFSASNLATVLSSATFNTGSLLGIDTTNAGGTLTYPSAITGNVGLSKQGSGTLVLGGSSTNAGAMTIGGGTVKLSGSGSATTNPLGLGTVTVSSGGMLDIGGYTLGNAKALTLNGGALSNSGGAASYAGAVTIGQGLTPIGGSGDITLNAALVAGANQFEKVGAGTLTLTTNSTSTGGVKLSNGTLRLNSATALGTTASPVTLNSGTLAIGNNAAVTIGTVTIYQPSTLSIGAGSTLQFGVVTNNANTVTLTGGGNFIQPAAWGVGPSSGGIVLDSGFTGTATFNAANTYTGGLLVKSGSVVGITNANAFGANTNVITLGDTTGSANATLSADGRTFANPINVQAGSSGMQNIVGTGGATPTIFSGAISGAGALTTAGNITLSSASSTFSGNLTVSSGTLKVGGSTVPNMPNTVTIANSSVLDLNGTNVAVGGLSGSGGTVNTGVAKVLTLAGSGTYSYAGTITASTPANLAVAYSLGATGVQTLSGANTYAGATTLNSGKLNINNASALGTIVSALSISGGVMDNTSGGAVVISNTAGISITGDFSAFSAGSTSTSNLTLGTGAVNLNMSTPLPGIASKTITLNGTGTTLTLPGTASAISSYSNSLLNVNGAGNTLIFGGLNISANAANARTLAFGGSANITINGLLTSVSASSALDYAGTGTLTLAGSAQSPVTGNGAMSVYGGTWKLDESAMAGTQNILLATNTFNLQGGALTVYGGNQTFAALNASTPGNTITLDAGAGAGATLTATTFTRNAGSTTLVDLTNAGTGSFVANNLTANTALLGNVVVKNGATYAFGATNGSKAIVATAAATSSLTASSNSSGTNFVTDTSDPAYLSGTLALSANAHQTNTLLVNTGTTSGVLNLAGNDLTFATTGLLLTGSGNYAIQNGRLGNGFSVEIDIHQFSAGTLTIASNISNAGSAFVLGGSGNVVLSGSFAGTGPISIGGGGTTTLQTGFGTNNNNLTLSGVAKLDLNGLSITTTGAVTNNSANGLGITNSGASATLTMGNNSQGGVNSNISGNLNLVFNPGANTSVFNGSFANTGNITVNDNGVGGATFGNMNAAGSVLIGTGTVNNAGSIVNTGTGSGAFTINSSIGASVTGISQNNPNTSLTLTGLNTAYNGITTIAAGSKLYLASATALGGNGSATGTGGGLVLNGNNTIDNTSGGALALTTANAISLNGDLTFVGTNNLSFGSGAVTLANGNRSLTLSANTLTFNGTVGDGGLGYGISKVGNGSLTLTASNSYSGATNFSGGTLTVNGAAGRLANTTAVTLSGGAVLNLGDATAGNGIANRINTGASLTLGGISGAGQTNSSNGTLSIVNGSTVANSQSFTSLTINPFSNDTINGSGTTNKGSVTFTGATPYTHGTGGLVNLDDTNLSAITFANAPSGAGNVVNGMLIGALKRGNDFQTSVKRRN